MVKFRVQRALMQQTESEAKTKVNNRDGGGAEEGAFVVELKSSTSWIIMYVVYKETTLQRCVCITPQ